ncbi:MAG: RnfABCDGE type electron transport complex subunit D [Phycisphaerae bacterium]|nr:RnfABCDGE type electron transport complex subunit D [Phycisphaerae bacterium]
MTEETNSKNPEKQSSVETAVLAVAPAPHIRDQSTSTRRMMIDVIIALVPLMIASVVMFRGYAILQLVVCVGSCLIAEIAFTAMRKRKAPIGDCSAIITGIILAMSLPWNLPIYVGVIGSFIAIGLGKVIFGGLGFNIFNPAMVGRAFIMLSFATAMGAPAYVKNIDQHMPWLQDLGALPSQCATGPEAQQLTTKFGDKFNAETGATPMTAAKKLINKEPNGYSTKLLSLFLGNTTGSLGETSALACLLGGLYLLIRKTAAWQIPLGGVIAVAIASGIADLCNGPMAWSFLHELLGGAFLFGVFFIATDPVTTPTTSKGKFIFGLGFGLMMMFIRLFSAYPEGVMFAILLMNAVTPLINRWTVPKPFGGPAVVGK